MLFTFNLYLDKLCKIGNVSAISVEQAVIALKQQYELEGKASTIMLKEVQETDEDEL